AEKNNHAAEPHDQKRVVRTQTLCVCSRGGSHFVPSCFYLCLCFISSPPEVLATRREKAGLVAWLSIGFARLTLIARAHTFTGGYDEKRGMARELAPERHKKLRGRFNQ